MSCWDAYLSSSITFLFSWCSLHSKWVCVCLCVRLDSTSHFFQITQVFCSFLSLNGPSVCVYFYFSCFDFIFVFSFVCNSILMLMLEQDDEIFSVLLSPKTYRVAFFFYSNAHSFFFIKGACVRQRSFTFVRWLLLWEWLDERSWLCTQTSTKKNLRINHSINPIFIFDEHDMHPLELYFDVVLAMGN